MLNNPLSLIMSALGGNLNSVIQNLMAGRMQGHPLMQQFNKMMNGKSPTEQFQTILNSAQSMGIDINEKCFTKAQLANMGIKIP